MKFALTVLASVFLAVPQLGFSQSFVNPDFEAANVSGYSVLDAIPTTNAFPGWTAFYFTGGVTGILSQVTYDGISLGSAAISVVDSNAPGGFGQLQGEYSAYLFGSFGYSVGVSQTGLVPAGTQSLQMNAYSFYGFTVTLNGQILNMIPLATNSPNDIVYAADVSAFAGQVATLSLIAPPLANPNGAEFDSIVFSPSFVPEPDSLGLLALGGLFFGLSCWRKSSN